MAALLASEWGVSDARQIGPPHKGKVFRLETPRGTLAFKLSRTAMQGDDRIEQTINRIAELTGAGTIVTPRLLPTHSGRLLTEYHGRAAYLMEWVHGRRVDLADTGEMAEVVRLLARLHLATEFEPDAGAGLPRDRVLHIITDMRRRADFILERVSGQAGTDSDAAGLRRLAEDAVRAELMARLSLLHALDDVPSARLCLCHHDTHMMNFIIDRDDRMVVLDFDRMGPGLGCEDLFSPLHRLVERHQWRFATFETVLGEYTALRPISRAEIGLILANLFYPRRALKGLAKNLAKNRQVQSGRFDVKLLRESMLTVTIDPLRRRFLQEAVRRYKIPLLGLTHVPLNSDELPAWIDAV
jgi:Ser/Thr protein kinase RdoA (MazF antagonist)